MERIPEITHPGQMSEHQRRKWHELVAGGTAGGSRDVVRGPNKVFLHSPELALGPPAWLVTSDASLTPVCRRGGASWLSWPPRVQQIAPQNSPPI
jgi:hypothetical protein